MGQHCLLGDVQLRQLTVRQLTEYLLVLESLLVVLFQLLVAISVTIINV